MGLFSTKDTDGDHEIAFDFHFPTSKNALIIFTRNPELGKCKTRLAAKTGDLKALEIYKFLLQHTVDITKNLSADKYVFYSEKIWKEDIWNRDIFRKKLQRGDDLGVRMQNAFNELFEAGYEKIIIIGSDMYDLHAPDLENAFSALNDHDYVIGPAEDGGYYLLGMKHNKEALFKNKRWGTETVLKETLNDLKNESVFKLSFRNDIDHYEDLQNIEAFQKFL